MKRIIQVLSVVVLVFSLANVTFAKTKNETVPCSGIDNYYYIFKDGTEVDQDKVLACGIKVDDAKKISISKDLREVDKNDSNHFKANSVYFFDEGTYAIGGSNIFNGNVRNSYFIGLNNHVRVTNYKTNCDGLIDPINIGAFESHFRNLIFDGKFNELNTKNNQGAITITGENNIFDNITLEDYLASSVTLDFTNKPYIPDSDNGLNIINNLVIKTNEVNNEVPVITISDKDNIQINDITYINDQANNSSLQLFKFKDLDKVNNEALGKNANIELNGEFNAYDNNQNKLENLNVYANVENKEHGYGNIEVSGKTFKFAYVNQEGYVTRLDNKYNNELLNSENYIYDNRSNDFIVDAKARTTQQEQVNNLLNLVKKTSVANPVEKHFGIKVIVDKKANQIKIDDLEDYAITMKAYKNIDHKVKRDIYNYTFNLINNKNDFKLDGFAYLDLANLQESNQVQKPDSQPMPYTPSASQNSNNNEQKPTPSDKPQNTSNINEGTTHVSSNEKLPVTGQVTLVVVCILVLTGCVTLIFKKKIELG